MPPINLQKAMFIAAAFLLYHKFVGETRYNSDQFEKAFLYGKWLGLNYAIVLIGITLLTSTVETAIARGLICSGKHHGKCDVNIV